MCRLCVLSRGRQATKARYVKISFWQVSVTAGVEFRRGHGHPGTLGEHMIWQVSATAGDNNIVPDTLTISFSYLWLVLDNIGMTIDVWVVRVNWVNV